MMRSWSWRILLNCYINFQIGQSLELKYHVDLGASYSLFFISVYLSLVIIWLISTFYQVWCYCELSLTKCWWQFRWLYMWGKTCTRSLSVYHINLQQECPSLQRQTHQSNMSINQIFVQHVYAWIEPTFAASLCYVSMCLHSVVVPFKHELKSFLFFLCF